MNVLDKTRTSTKMNFEDGLLYYTNSRINNYSKKSGSLSVPMEITALQEIKEVCCPDNLQCVASISNFSSIDSREKD